ncbi:MAG: ISKra4 family transposase [Saprospiraceae bacterium]
MSESAELLRDGPPGQLEERLRETLREGGRRLLGELLNQPGLELPGDARLPGERVLEAQPRSVQTLLGEVIVHRRGYYDAEAGSVRYPLDEAMGLIGGWMPGLAKLAGRLAARTSYEDAGEDLSACLGFPVEYRGLPRLVRRIGAAVGVAVAGMSAPPVGKNVRLYVSADGTGIPLRPDELKGRAGRQADGSARTHEVKVGCVFTQSLRAGGEPLRDPDSTTYTATLGRVDTFAPQLLKEARRRHMDKARQVVFISDAAAWLREMRRTHFPEAVWVLDFYHAATHVRALADALFGKESREAERFYRSGVKRLLAGKSATVVSGAGRVSQPTDPVAAAREKSYLAAHHEGMRYDEFQREGIFIGSGVIEASCKSVVGQRFKQSGMFWSQRGAEDLLPLRCALSSGLYDQAWTPCVLRRIRDAA